MVVQGRPKANIIWFGEVRGNDEMVNYELSAGLTPTTKSTITNRSLLSGRTHSFSVRECINSLVFLGIIL